MASPALITLSHTLIARDNTNATHGKSLEEWDDQGRYAYEPNLPATWIFFALFGVALLVNIFQYFWYRCWFWWPMLLAALMETVGFLTRALSINNIHNKPLFIVQTILILVAPAVMAASCYMAFGRLILWIIPTPHQTFRTLWLPARHITPLFVGFDVVSFLLQCAGGAMLASASSQSSLDRGRTIVLIGLAVQLVVFGFFVVATIRLSFLLRTKLRGEKLPHERNWGVLLGMVYVACVLILVRSVYRFVEYAMGTSSYLYTHEVFFYCLDAALMWLVFAGFICLHPAQYLAHIGFRRKEISFSKHVEKGLFKGLAKGPGEKAMDEGSAMAHGNWQAADGVGRV